MGMCKYHFCPEVGPIAIYKRSRAVLLRREFTEGARVREPPAGVWSMGNDLIIRV